MKRWPSENCSGAGGVDAVRGVSAFCRLVFEDGSGDEGGDEGGVNVGGGGGGGAFASLHAPHQMLQAAAAAPLGAGVA